MPDSSSRNGEARKVLANSLAQMRGYSKLTQTEVAKRMATTQAAIARLESGTQSPSVRTLLNFARANGLRLEIGFVRSAEEADRLECIVILEDAGRAPTVTGAED